ncbi:type II secretion system F family protein [Planomonospora alba]|uniref:Type II secretion system F family protein n=1 Tax=Planomonospora alba TaxID=161354 RepID=A0ABP6P3A1_9ACTN
MTGQVLLSVLAGAGAGAGLLLIVSGLRRGGDDREHRERLGRGPRADRRTLVRLAASLAAAAAVALLTRWPVGTALAGLAGWFLPGVLGPDREHARTVERIEAVASWAEMLRDVLVTPTRLQQVVTATAPIAPQAIRSRIVWCAARVDRGEPLPDALRQLAAELADPTGDLVCSALVLAAGRRTDRLGDLLGALADTARAHAALRLRVADARARARASARAIVVATAAAAGALVVFNREFLAPYDTVDGQFVLLVTGLVCAASFLLLHRTGRIADPPRLPPSGTGGGEG